MLDAALDAVVSIDRDGAIVEFNPAAERIFGFTREAVIGGKMADLLVPPALRAAHRAGFDRYLATGEGKFAGKRVEVTALRADGSEFPLELSIAAAALPGEPIFTAYLRDISEQKQRERALLESEAIVASSFDAIVGRSSDGVITSWNAAAERTFGYSAEEMLGQLAELLVPVDSDVVAGRRPAPPPRRARRAARGRLRAQGRQADRRRVDRVADHRP